MQCHEIRDLLSAHLDGALKPSDSVLVASHLEACSDCSRELENLRMVVSLLQTMPEISPPADFRINLRKRLEAATPSLPSKRKGILAILTGAGLSRRLAVAASLLVVMGSVAILYGHSNQWGHKNDSPLNNNFLGGKNVAILNNEAKTKEIAKETSESASDMQVNDVATAGEAYIAQGAQRESENKEDSARINADDQTPAKDGASGGENRLYTMAVPEKADEAMQEKEAGSTQDMRGGTEGAPSGAPAAFKTILTPQRKIVKEAEVSLTAKDTETAAGKVSSLALSLGGQVEASENAGGNTLVLKIPVDRYDELMGRLVELGVQNRKASEKDITNDYNSVLENIDMLENREGAASLSAPKDELNLEIETNRLQLKDYEDSLQNALIKVKIIKEQ